MKARLTARRAGAPHASRARRVARLAAATGLAASLAAIGSAADGGAAHADTPGFYKMTSAANTISVEVDMANVPLLAPQLVFLSPGSAQAHLDSSGDSNAYAGAPFIGQTLDGVGGLVSGLGAGVLPPLPPSLPGYIETSNPSDPSADDSQGPYTLTATSGPNSSTSTAGIAAESGQPRLLSATATATTSFDPTTGSLISTATSLTQPLMLGSFLQIGTVQCTATMTVDKGGHLTQTSSANLGSISVAGIQIGLSQAGVRVLGSTLPLPSLRAVNTLLASDGISLKLLPATRTSTGITSAGLQVTLTKNIPVEGASALIVTVGQSNAQLQYALVTTPPGNADQGIPLTSVPTALATAPIPSATSAPAQAGTAATQPTASTPVQVASGPTPEAIPANQQVTPTLAQLAGRLGPDAISWYFILVAAALALTAASRAAGHLAVSKTRSKAKGSR